ncbi:LysR family transcriptional regulator, partial [Acidaminococcus timonensis]
MNLEQLNCFIAVVEEGSISAGARRLNLTQPARQDMLNFRLGKKGSLHL